MNKLLIAALATLSLSVNAGEHVLSSTIAYGGVNTLFQNVQPRKIATNTQFLQIPEGVMEWLAVYTESHCASGPDTWLRIWVEGTDDLSKMSKGSLGGHYYTKILKPCESERVTFPVGIHTFHNLKVEAKCFNRNTKEPESCIGYVIMYGK